MTTEITIGLHTAGGKIREYSAQDLRWMECHKVLNRAAFSVGITLPLSSMEFQVIKDFLQTEFKDFSAAEISEAFSKYAAHKLSFTDKPYNNMNNLFISNVLIAYRKYRNEQLSKHNIEVKAVLPAAKINTDEENYFELLLYVEKNARLPEWGSNIYLSAYAYFDKAVSAATIEDKKAFAEKIKNRKEDKINFLKTQGLSQNIRAEIRKITTELERKLEFANECRVEFIKEYLIKKFSL
jgi:hypothetical protein